MLREVNLGFKMATS
jgi:dynein intermediate chain 2